MSLNTDAHHAHFLRAGFLLLLPFVFLFLKLTPMTEQWLFDEILADGSIGVNITVCNGL